MANDEAEVGPEGDEKSIRVTGVRQHIPEATREQLAAAGLADVTFGQDADELPSLKLADVPLADLLTKIYCHERHHPTGRRRLIAGLTRARRGPGDDVPQRWLVRANSGVHWPKTPEQSITLLCSGCRARYTVSIPKLQAAAAAKSEVRVQDILADPL